VKIKQLLRKAEEELEWLLIIMWGGPAVVAIVFAIYVFTFGNLLIKEW